MLSAGVTYGLGACSCGSTMLSPTDSAPTSAAPRLAASMIDGPPPEQTTNWRIPFSSGGKLLAIRASRSEEHTSELQSLMRISYAVFCLKKKKTHKLQKLALHVRQHH